MSEWRAQARAFVLEYAVKARVFSANDLWAAGLPVPSNRRNLSRVLLTLEADGVLRRTGRLVSSHGGHGQPITEWSLA